MLRMSFALAVYHLIILMSIIPRATCSMALHDGFWPVKGLLLVLIYIGSFFLPTAAMIFYAQFSRIVSGLYLIFQTYFLLNQCYAWTNQLLEIIDGSKKESDKSYAQCLLLFYSIFSTAGCVTWLVYQFIWFGGCALGGASLGILCFFLLFFYVVSLLPLCNVRIFRQNANIFTVSLVTLYLTYLVWTSLASVPDQTCNPFTQSSGNTVAQILVGIVFTFATVLSVATAS